MDRCPNCGASVRPGARFCTACGHRLTQPESPLPTAVTSPEEPTRTMPSSDTAVLDLDAPDRPNDSAASPADSTIDAMAADASSETEPAAIDRSEDRPWGTSRDDFAPVSPEDEAPVSSNAHDAADHDDADEGADVSAAPVTGADVTVAETELPEDSPIDEGAPPDQALSDTIALGAPESEASDESVSWADSRQDDDLPSNDMASPSSGERDDVTLDSDDRNEGAVGGSRLGEDIVVDTTPSGESFASGERDWASPDFVDQLDTTGVDEGVTALGTNRAPYGEERTDQDEAAGSSADTGDWGGWSSDELGANDSGDVPAISGATPEESAAAAADTPMKPVVTDEPDVPNDMAPAYVPMYGEAERDGITTSGSASGSASTSSDPAARADELIDELRSLLAQLAGQAGAAGGSTEFSQVLDAYPDQGLAEGDIEELERRVADVDGNEYDFRYLQALGQQRTAITALIEEYRRRGDLIVQLRQLTSGSR